MPGPETKWSGVFGKIPDLDWDHGVWSGPDWVPIGPGPNFPNTNMFPLMMFVCNGRQFVWTLLYDKCLESIKALACWAPMLKPIDTNNPDPIWVI